MAEQVSIITTTYRNYDKLEKCLSSVAENTKFVDYKHYVWANLPDDRIKKIIHNSMFIDDILFNDRIEPIFNDNNDGSFSANNNEAIKDVEGKYVLLLNDDCMPIREDWLYNMVRVLETDEKVGIVGALLFYPDQKTIQHCGVFFSSKTNNLPYHMFYRQSLDKVSNFVIQPRYYQAVTGACMLIRREDYLSVGGLEEKYWYCYEDIDLCLKVKEQLKKHCVFLPDAQLIHDEGISKDGKNNPKFEHNIKTFRDKWAGKYLNDLDFYLSNPKHLIYNKKAINE